MSITARGDCTHILVVGATGQIASTPASGSRTMPLANDDAALLGLPGRTVTVGRRSERPSMKPLRVMSYTRYSPIAFCAPYEACGISGASSGTGSGSGPPNTASELVNTNLGGAASVAATLEQRARGVEVDAHADVELRLRLPADDGGEMEHACPCRARRRARRRRVGEVAGDGRHARVAGQRRGRDVDERDRRDRAHASARVGERAALEELAGEAGAQEPGAAGDHDVALRRCSRRSSQSAL